MDFSGCNVRIVDAVMGAGKSQSIINLINNSGKVDMQLDTTNSMYGDNDRWLVITNYLSEVTRYQESCKDKHFKAPKERKENGRNKLQNLKTLICRGENIISTHALFSRFDEDLIDICRAANYTLVLNVAYIVNRYLNPYVKQFFTSNGIEVDEDGYAMSEMLQFLWRSAIREGQGINVYIPSVRMRNLLKQWIKDNPLI